MAAFPVRSIKRLLVANRGEIAARIISTARELNVETYSIYTLDDSNHTLGSSHSLLLESPDSYLNIPELVTLVRENKIDAVHPGYGFLSESPEFARAMWEQANAVVIGPGFDILERTGDKLQARSLAEECNVPVLAALADPTSDVEKLRSFGTKVGYPIIIKAVDGGGGRGIRIVREEKDLENLARRALMESPSGRAFAEKAAVNGYRHIEVQIVGDGNGNVRHLWERECSIQRRFQKVAEFTPSSIKDRELIAKVIEAAMRMARKVRYSSLGTFEFLVRSFPPEFYFLEINPRLQVEHTITESISMGIDLVKVQLLLAQGQPLSKLLLNLHGSSHHPPPLHSLQLRVTAEDASNGWALSVGKIDSFRLPTGNGIRVDTNLVSSQPLVIGTDFDSLIAKIIITAPSWEDVVQKARRALEDTYINGVKTSLDVLRGIVANQAFACQECDTQWLETSLSKTLEIGRRLVQQTKQNVGLSQVAKSTNNVVAGASSVLFRKGDAWSISLVPELAKSDATRPIPSHLELTQVLRNEFPNSLTAQIKYTSPTMPTSSYLMTLASTTASFASISSATTHRRGDSGNQNHVIVPFAGKMIELLVAKGDDILKGDVVAVIRQMKMEVEIRSNKGGRVRWVYEGKEGDDVGEGVLVAELEATNSRL